MNKLDEIKRNGIRLSEAILKGADMRFSCTTKLFRIEHCTLCSCALGAALEGTYGENILRISDAKFLSNNDFQDKMYTILNNLFPELYNFFVDKKYLSKYEYFVDDIELNRQVSLWNFIITLNDSKHFSRQQIAGFVAELGY